MIAPSIQASVLGPRHPPATRRRFHSFGSVDNASQIARTPQYLLRVAVSDLSLCSNPLRRLRPVCATEYLHPAFSKFHEAHVHREGPRSFSLCPPSSASPTLWQRRESCHIHSVRVRSLEIQRKRPKLPPPLLSATPVSAHHDMRQHHNPALTLAPNRTKPNHTKPTRTGGTSCCRWRRASWAAAWNAPRGPYSPS